MSKTLYYLFRFYCINQDLSFLYTLSEIREKTRPTRARESSGMNLLSIIDPLISAFEILCRL